MTTLQKLRTHQGLLIGLILFALLAFIVGDIISSRDRLADSSRTTVGALGDNALKVDEYNTQINQILEQNQGVEISRKIAAENVWNYWLETAILGRQFEKLGISASNAAILNAIAKMPEAEQYFKNSLGTIEPEGIIEWARYARELRDKGEQGGAEMWQLWENFKAAGEERAKTSLYFLMLQQGVNVTSLDAKMEHLVQQTQADAEIVFLPYDSLDSKEIKISDDEILAYEAKHEKEFKRSESRDIQYAYIPVTPSLEDETAARQKMEGYLEDRVQFNTRTNENDTILGFPRLQETDVEHFVNSYTDAGSRYDNRLVHGISYSAELNDWAFTAKIGDVSPIIEDEGVLRIARLMNIESIPDSVSSSHILITYAGTPMQAASARSRDDAKKLADSLLVELNSGKAEFNDIAARYSEDPNSANSGGSMGYTTYNGAVPQLDDFLFHNGKGAMRVIETGLGYHIFKIDEANTPSKAVRVAVIANAVNPSKETTSAVLSRVLKLEGMKESAEGFAAYARSQGYTVTPVEGLTILESTIPGIGEQSQIVRWAFEKNRQMGDVRYFDLTDAYVVAVLSGKTEAGLESPARARAAVEPVLMKEKKGKILEAKLKAAKGKSLEEIAAEVGVTPVVALSVTLSNPTLPEIGMENKLTGAILGTEKDALTPVIVGENGVGIARVTEKREAEKDTDTSFYKQILAMQQQNYAMFALEGLRKSAEKELKDNREAVESFYQ